MVMCCEGPIAGATASTTPGPVTTVWFAKRRYERLLPPLDRSRPFDPTLDAASLRIRSGRSPNASLGASLISSVPWCQSLEFGQSLWTLLPVKFVKHVIRAGGVVLTPPGLHQVVPNTPALAARGPCNEPALVLAHSVQLTLGSRSIRRAPRSSSRSCHGAPVFVPSIQPS